ncbi:MAG: hypothetical protein WA317_01530 [Mycobacterium sp.]|uniref:hypothetical protein n=1 Tax=Mycobacterium sp. TaxID=1785 RepID=UPI003CC64650
MSEAVSRVRVLLGHVGPDTAYVVDDYPYGVRLRCKIRYWIESGCKGAGKGQQRMVSQTTNPKAAGEVWNKPKPSTYSALRVLYLDDVGHVQGWGCHIHLSPVADARMRLMGIYEQLTERDRETYDLLLRMSHGYERQWTEWAERVSGLAEHMRTTGTDPEIQNGCWVRPSGDRVYLFDAAGVALAVARGLIVQRERAPVAVVRFGGGRYVDPETGLTIYPARKPGQTTDAYWIEHGDQENGEWRQ